MAKKFRFKLESVLKFRADKVEQAKDSLNQVIRIRIEKEKAIMDNIELKNELALQNPIKVKARDLQAKTNHIIFLNEEIVRLEEEKKSIIEIENIRRVKLTKALKDEKVIEKLKEKQLNEHIDIMNKEDSKFMDELGIMGIPKIKDSGL